MEPRMPGWVEISGQDVVMITFACVYVLAGLGMYLSLVRGKPRSGGMDTDIRRVSKTKLGKSPGSAPVPRGSFQLS